MANVQLLIQNTAKGIIYEPLVEDDIKWETERAGSPGKLTFTVLKDDIIDFQEGNPVKLIVDGKGLFFGYVFSKSRNKDGLIKVTAYDQLRYFKNKDTYIYTNKTAAALLKMLVDDFKLKWGIVEDTGYAIPKKIEDNKTLFDIVQNALDDTLRITKNMYVLYDDYGRITLKNIKNMKLDLLIDEETAEDFDYTSSIDSNTYNQVKLVYENEETGKRDVYIVKDSSNINKWGILQYFDKLKSQEGGQAKAEALLKLYNKKTRNLSIKDAFGDIRVRAGSTIAVNLNIGDIIVQNYMMVEKCTHTFVDNHHSMTLSLKGGEFIG